jgi:hypothetical protein
MAMTRAPDQRALLESAIVTVESVLLPELGSPWARGVAIGLIGQLRYAMGRLEDDTLADQDAALERCIDSLLEAHPELREVVEPVSEAGDRSWRLRDQAARLLVYALAGGQGATSIQSDLRPLLMAQADQDLGQSGPLLGAFLQAGSVGAGGADE